MLQAIVMVTLNQKERMQLRKMNFSLMSSLMISCQETKMNLSFFRKLTLKEINWKTLNKESRWFSQSYNKKSTLHVSTIVSSKISKCQNGFNRVPKNNQLKS
jgi:hypothetical protein